MQRVSTEEIADKRRMFDLFTSIENCAKKDKNDSILADAEDALSLWTQMLVDEQKKYHACEASLGAMQFDCDGWLAELLSILEGIDRESELETVNIEVPLESLPEPPPKPRAKLLPNMELAALIDYCDSISAELKLGLSSNPVSAHSKVDHRSKRSRTTVSSATFPPIGGN